MNDKAELAVVIEYDPQRKYRINFRCKKCDVVHAAIGVKVEILYLANQLMDEGITYIVQDDVVAHMDEADISEAISLDPKLRDSIMHVFHKMGKNGNG